MMLILPSTERGHFDHGWLNTYHTFSFGDYQNPERTGFRSLRVINEDRVQPSEGFGTHGHRDMEIITYVLSGALEHKDSLGNGGILKHHHVQRMRAGTGIRHSEANPGADAIVHFYQIWILPRESGLQPGYIDRAFDPAPARGTFQLLVSPDGREGSLDIAQDVCLYRLFLEPGKDATLPLDPKRNAWVQMAEGTASLNAKEKLQAGDGAMLSGEKNLSLRGETPVEALIFDLG
jgi:redox-sensitive bicupin YhaK (pirin superfamily)